MNFKNYCKLREEDMPQDMPQVPQEMPSDQGGGGEGWASQLAQAAAGLPPYILQQSIDQLNAFDPQQMIARIQQRMAQQQPQGHPQRTQQNQQNQQASPNWVGQQPGMN